MAASSSELTEKDMEKLYGAFTSPKSHILDSNTTSGPLFKIMLNAAKKPYR